VIRNVVMGRLRETDDDAQASADAAELDSALAALAALRLPGMLDMRTGRDLGLREGGWDFAITNDWVDADAYRAYDVEAEHNVQRARIAAVAGQVVRVQFPGS
jgi:Stress responsive A/B Barrel Domain